MAARAINYTGSVYIYERGRARRISKMHYIFRDLAVYYLRNFARAPIAGDIDPLALSIDRLILYRSYILMCLFLDILRASV